MLKVGYCPVCDNTVKTFVGVNETISHCEVCGHHVNIHEYVPVSRPKIRVDFALTDVVEVPINWDKMNYGERIRWLCEEVNRAHIKSVVWSYTNED